MGQFLRWIAVLPGALIAVLLVNFPLHLVLLGLTGFAIVEPYRDVELPERVLSRLVNALGFVWFGARIAPSRRVGTSVVLLGLVVLTVGATFALVEFGWTIGGREIAYMNFGVPVGVSTALTLGGGLVGVHLTRKHARGDSRSRRLARGSATPGPTGGARSI